MLLKERTNQRPNKRDVESVQPPEKNGRGHRQNRLFPRLKRYFCGRWLPRGGGGATGNSGRILRREGMRQGID